MIVQKVQKKLRMMQRVIMMKNLVEKMLLYLKTMIIMMMKKMEKMVKIMMPIFEKTDNNRSNLYNLI